MKRTLIALTLAGFGFAAPALAGPLEDQFFAMDTNRDGAITRAEYVAFQTREGATERQANFAFDNTAGDDSRISLNEFRSGPVARTQSSATTSRAQAQPRQRQTRQSTRSGGGRGS